MKLHKLALLFFAAASVALTGCNVADDTKKKKKTTFLGIYTYEPGCYSPSNADTALTARTDDMIGMELPSGDRTQFLWGLISVEDY